MGSRSSTGAGRRRPPYRGCVPSPGGEVRDDHLTEHAAVPVAQLRVDQVAAEEGAEGVPVGDPEDTEGTDHHVYIDRVDVLAEEVLRATAGQDPVNEVDRGGVEVTQAGQLRDVLAVVDVLDTHQADEVRVRLVVVEGDLSQVPDRFD